MMDAILKGPGLVLATWCSLMGTDIAQYTGTLHFTSFKMRLRSRDRAHILVLSSQAPLPLSLHGGMTCML